MKLIITFLLPIIITTSIYSQIEVDTVYYSSGYSICLKEKAYYYRFMKFDNDTTTSGQTTRLVKELPKNKAKLKKALLEGRFTITKNNGKTIRESVFINEDKKDDKYSYAKLTKKEIVINNSVHQITNYRYNYEGKLRQIIIQDSNSSRIGESHYYENDNLKMTYTYIDGITKKKKYYESGLLKEEVNYNVYREKVGSYKYYRENGQLLESKSFYKKNGIRIMDVTSYYESGAIGEVKKFKLAPEYNDFNEYNNLHLRTKISNWITYDEIGNIIKEFNYGNEIE